MKHRNYLHNFLEHFERRWPLFPINVAVCKGIDNIGLKRWPTWFLVHSLLNKTSDVRLANATENSINSTIENLNYER